MILDRPPKDWKRPGIPKRVKAKVMLAQGGRCKATGEKLERRNTHFDHRPELWERKFDTEAWDTIPPANSPDDIEAITVAAHDIRTNGPGGEKRVTSAGSGAHRRAKGERLKSYQEDIRATVFDKPCGAKRQKTGSIKSRGFERTKRGFTK